MAIKTFKEIINNKGYRIDSNDRKIFEEGNLQSFFGVGDNDAIEFIVYDSNDNQLPQQSANNATVRYVPLTTENISDYFLIAEGTLLQKFQFPNEYFIDAERLLREAGYNNGIFKTQITLINKRVGSDKEGDKLWISEISPSRTEIRLFPIKNAKVKNAELEERFSMFISNKEFRDDTIVTALSLIEKVDSNIIGTYLKTQYTEQWVNKMLQEFKIKSFDEFVAKINFKFRESAIYEFTNRISDIDDVNYGKRKQTKNPLSLAKDDIMVICKRLLIKAVNFYLPTQDNRDKASFNIDTNESLDIVGQVLQTESSDLLVDTSSPVVVKAQAKTLLKTNKELELDKQIQKELPYPTKGILLSKYCEGVDLYGTYADGNGGEYKALILANSTECGYNQPDLGDIPRGGIIDTGGSGGGSGLARGGSVGGGGGFIPRRGPEYGREEVIEFDMNQRENIR